MPPSQGGIRAGKAFVELALRDKLDGGLRKASARLRAFATGVEQIGRRMMAVSAAMAVPFAFAAKTFAGFSDTMLAVRGVTGAVGQDFDMLEAKAKKLGRTMSFTAQQVAEGMLNLGRAGFKPAEIDASIEGVMNLARATGTDLALAADIASGTLRAFGLEAGKMGMVTDVLVATANNSAQTLEDLGESMKYAAPIAEEYGLSLQQTAKALGVLANMQIKGSMAGTSLRQTMLQLADPGVQQQLQGMGVEAVDAAGNLRPLGDILTEIGKAMADMGSGERLALATSLFGKRAAGGALKLAKTDFDDLAKAIDNANGVAAETAKTMDSGLGGAFRKMMSAVEGVLIAVGDSLSGALGTLAGTITALAQDFAKWIEKNRQVVVTIMKVVAGVGVLGAALVTLKTVVMVVAFAFSGLGAILTVYRAIATAATVASTVLSGALAFMAANPLAMVAVGLGALIIAMVGWELITRKMSAAMSGLIPSVQLLGDTSHKTADAIRAEYEAMTQKANRLAELRSKQDLTNAEMAEAKTLANDLKSVYPSLASEIDTLGQSAETTASMLGKMGDAMAASTTENYKQSLAQAEAELKGLIKQGAEARKAQDLIREDKNPTKFYVPPWQRPGRRAALETAKVTAGTLPGTLAKIEKLQARIAGLKAELGDGTIERTLSAHTPEKTIETSLGANYDDDFMEKFVQGEDLTKQIQDDIGRLEIEVQFKGHTRQVLLLQHEMEAAIAEAVRLGLDPKIVEKQFELRRRKMNLERERETTEMGTIGTFSAATAMRGLGFNDPATRTAKATEETAKNTKRTDKKLDELGSFK